MKNIVILSTEPWGKILLSKMHFAIELAAMGNQVFFVNPPVKNESRQLVDSSKDDAFPNITFVYVKSIKNALFLRHKFLWVYEWIVNKYVREIRKIIEGGIDEVWCFNPQVYTGFKYFHAKKNILFLYDFYKGAHVFKAAANADFIVSPSQLILDYYKKCTTPKLLLQHGLSSNFAILAKDKLVQNKFPVVQSAKIKIGYTGNLCRGDMVIDAVRKIIEQHKDKEFHFWGPYSFTENNVTDRRVVMLEELNAFIDFLKQCPHVYLYGIKEQDELAKEMSAMDLFLCFYDAAKDMNSSSNSHKLLEYLSTGKTVVSTFISNYAGTDWLTMCNDENDLPELFNEVVNNLDEYNSADNQKRRIAFALDNTYVKQVERINQFIYN